QPQNLVQRKGKNKNKRRTIRVNTRIGISLLMANLLFHRSPFFGALYFCSYFTETS
uniref:Uncharacterized protein n=1 Tax=Solanum lycopersicum TaxID=4081 RepID=A0A3Q7FHR8_SOLLC